MSWNARGVKAVVVKQLADAKEQPHNTDAAKLVIQKQLELVEALPEREGFVIVANASGHIDSYSVSVQFSCDYYKA